MFSNFIKVSSSYYLILYYKISKEEIYAFAVIELACGEYGEDKLDMLINGSQNGSNLQWFENSAHLMDAKSLRGR